MPATQAEPIARLCLVPVKPLALAKQRLADALDPAQRRALVVAMLADVLDATTAVLPTWVACSDDEVAMVAREHGATPVPDPCPEDGLNASLAALEQTAIAAGAQGLLVVAADCPAVRPVDIARLVLGPGIGIAPDRRGSGTNALWRSPPDAIPAVFGPGSRNGHASLAHIAGIPHAIVPVERVGLDVDHPTDLRAVSALGAGPATTALLAGATLDGGTDYPSPRR